MKQCPVEFGCYTVLPYRSPIRGRDGERERLAVRRCAWCGARHGSSEPVVCAACGSSFRDAAEASRDAGLDAVVEAQGLGRAARKSHMATGQGPFHCPFDLGSLEAEAWEAGYRNNLDRWTSVWAEARRGGAA